MRPTKMTLLLALALGALAGPRAHAQGDPGMALKWTHPLMDWDGTPAHPIARAADIPSLGDDGLFAEAESAIEFEGKRNFRDKRAMRVGASLLNRLAKDPKLAATILGEGYAIVKSATYTFNDVYRDEVDVKKAAGTDRPLARYQAGVRVRHVPGSGMPGQINGKPWTSPPGGVKLGADGVVAVRNERRLPIGSSPDFAAIGADQSDLNPVGWLKEKGLDAGKILTTPSAKVPDRRVRYSLVFQGLPVAEVSVDHVFAFQALAGKEGTADPRARHQKVTFFQLEADVGHPPITKEGKATATASGHVAGIANWTGPHTAKDLHRPELAADPALTEAGRVIGSLYGWMEKHGARMTTAKPKYTEGIERSFGTSQRVRSARPLDLAARGKSRGVRQDAGGRR